jgi:hypothetical protein
MLSGKRPDGDSLAPLWLAGSGFMVVALVLVLIVRPDPREDRRHPGTTGDPRRPTSRRRCSEIVRRPGVIPRCSPPGELRRDGRA